MSAVAVQSPPVANGHVGEHTDANGDVAMNGTSQEASNRFATGLILPPPEIKCEC
jgi:hypothetical protein